MFSYHPDRQRLGEGSCYAKGWIASPASAVTLSFAIQAWATSPIIFRDGVRREDHFIKADWVALDFDGGVSLREIVDTFCDTMHVIGTTKSHGRPKGEHPPCDRFRLWLALERPIDNVLDYKATVKMLVGRYDADPACVGGAQLFWPCTAISSVVGEGFRTPVVLAERKVYTPNSGVHNGRIPYWVRDWLDYDVVRIEREDARRATFGKDCSRESRQRQSGAREDERGCSSGVYSRNRLVFKCAVWLARNGWTENAIVDLVMGSKLPIDQSPRVYAEVRKAVASGVRRAKAKD